MTKPTYVVKGGGVGGSVVLHEEALDRGVLDLPVLGDFPVGHDGGRQGQDGGEHGELHLEKWLLA